MEFRPRTHGRSADFQVGQDGGHGDGEDGAEGEAVRDEGSAGLWGRGGELAGGGEMGETEGRERLTLRSLTALETISPPAPSMMASR